MKYKVDNPVAPTLEEVTLRGLTCVIHTPNKEDAICVVGKIPSSSHSTTSNEWLEYWDRYKANTCYYIVDGAIDSYSEKSYFENNNDSRSGIPYTIYEFSDLFATGGFCDGFRGGKIPTPSKPVSIEEQLGLPKGVSIHDLPTSELYNPMRLTFKNGSSIEAIPNEDAIRSKEPELVWIDKIALPTATETKEMVERVRREILKFTNAFPKEEKKLKFTFYTVEGYRMDKSNNTKIPTVTTEVVYKDKDGCATGGSATCDKADYSERDGILNAIANAVLGGNFDREYEKFLADKKRKYDESCKCKICGRNYYEDEKTGKRTPFTPEDARKHEEWHEQNKKNKREKYLIRKEAKRRLAEAEREGKIEQTMKELYKK